MIEVNGKKLKYGLYPNKESIIDTSFEESSSYNIVFQYLSNEDLMELYFVLSHIKYSDKNSKVRLFIRYMPYSRMDRSQNGSCFTLCYAVKLIATALPWGSSVHVMEPHSCKTVEEFRSHGIEVHEYLTSWSIADYVLALMEDISVVCYPDKGAVDRYSKIQNSMIDDAYTTVHCNKVRDFDTGKIIGLDLDNKEAVKDKSVLIIDDLCSRGGTFYHAANVLKDAGAKHVYLVVTHLEDVVIEGELLLEQSPIDHIWATSSMLKENSMVYLSNRVTLVSMDAVDLKLVENS